MDWKVIAIDEWWPVSGDSWRDKKARSCMKMDKKKEHVGVDKTQWLILSIRSLVWKNENATFHFVASCASCLHFQQIFSTKKNERLAMWKFEDVHVVICVKANNFLHSRNTEKIPSDGRFVTGLLLIFFLNELILNFTVYPRWDSWNYGFDVSKNVPLIHCSWKSSKHWLFL